MIFKSEIADKDLASICGLMAFFVIPIIQFFVTGSVDLNRETPDRTPFSMKVLYIIAIIGLFFLFIKNFGHFAGYFSGTNFVTINQEHLHFGRSKILMECVVSVEKRLGYLKLNLASGEKIRIFHSVDKIHSALID